MTQQNTNFEIWVEAYICSFHRVHPGEQFSGCSCCSAYGIGPKNPKEFYEANKEKAFDVLDELFTSETIQDDHTL